MKRIAVMVLFILLAIPAFCAQPPDGSAKAQARKHFKLSIALWDKYDGDHEIAELRKALALDPDFAEAHFNLGVALSEKDEFEEAVKEFIHAVRLVPRDDMAHHCLALALEKKGDLLGALKESKVAFTLDPKNGTYKASYERLLRSGPQSSWPSQAGVRSDVKAQSTASTREQSPTRP
jgi:tetratricopeptide (TPR) repeat protein